MYIKGKKYVAIDLKSFYASVECAERGLDPLDANLVVADESRTDKTICLAVSPSLKALGIPGRARLFEAKQKIREVNARRKLEAPGRRFSGKSIYASELSKNKSLELDLVVAPPRMSYYMEYSKSIVEIYMRHVSPDDILVYSIDEVFIDVTPYLKKYKMDAHSFTMMLIREVLDETRITATAGIGTNMYLAKIAMDIVAKHIPADKDGVRIAELNEMSYREQLWDHTPLTDFWRIGKGIARKLEQNGLFTMGDVAMCSEGSDDSYYNEDLLYKLFGINAELIIDHAWGWEPTEIKDCKSYKTESKSLSQGQVLSRAYTFDEGKIIAKEMADSLAMDLVKKGYYTNQVVLDVFYDTENLTEAEDAKRYRGDIVYDRYGRQAPKPAHGSHTFDSYTALSSKIVEAVSDIYDKVVDPNLMVRRFNLAVTRLLMKDQIKDTSPGSEQLDMFTDYEKSEKEVKEKIREEEKEYKIQKALVEIREKYGKNSVVKGMNMQDNATAMERNRQIGGHKA